MTTQPEAGVHDRAEQVAAPAIGIVVVTYNALGFTRTCLESLRQVTYPNTVIVVVDNASRDDSVARIREEFPDVVLLPQDENLGYTGGNNVGARWCLDHGCAGVLILNNDTRVEPDFLDAMVPRMREGCIVGPEIRSLADPTRVNDKVRWFDWRTAVALPDGVAMKRNGHLPARITSGCCFLVPRAVFEKIGGLDDLFFIYYEEVDFEVRAQQAGFVVVTEPRAVIYHRDEARAHAEMSPFQIYYSTRNRLLILKKHGQLTLRFLVKFGASRAFWALRFLTRGESRKLAAMLRAIRDFGTGRLGRVDYEW